MVSLNIQRKYLMGNHNNTITESEEMYLITTAKLVEAGIPEPVPLSTIAQTLAVQPVSANQKIHALETAGLVVYQPYKGVELTPAGQQVALRVLRFRRLWEVFLVRHLSLNLDEADALACRLEHNTTDDLADRLAQFLEFPAICYHGKVIPGDHIKLAPIFMTSLASMIPGQTGNVISVQAEPTSASFLASQGLQPGSRLLLLARGENGSHLVETVAGQLHLSAGLAETITITPIEKEREA
jgi:DtxR family transcriptional regulator, Mn-dependent transcriptional regulator